MTFASPAARPLSRRNASRGEDSPAGAKKRLRAVRKEAEAGRKRQAELVREIGVPDWSPEEVAERAGRDAYRR
jgi:hypothetical protein